MRDELYNNAKNLIRKSLEKLGANNSLKITVHQFGPTLLYLPVYILLRDICDESNHESSFTMEVEYVSNGTDKSTYMTLKESTGWDAKNGELMLGLSEIPEEFRVDAKNHIIDHDFINRVPLWGVSLVNNSRINWFKRRRHTRGGIQNGEEHQASKSDETMEIRLCFWNAFGGKISLLNPDDLVHEDVRLGVSIYPEGSTIFRLFEEYINRTQGDLSKNQVSFASEVTFDNEFDDLFCGIVDVAFTVQPWKAIREGLHQGKDTEIVYVHHAKPAAFTSLYTTRAPTGVDNKESVDDDVLQEILRLINWGVQICVDFVYEPDTNFLQRCAKVLAKENLPEVLDTETSTIQVDSVALEELECALYILGDSRIYFVDPSCMTETDYYKQVKRSVLEFDQAWFHRGVMRGDVDLREKDPIEFITNQIEVLENGKMHSIEQLNSFKTKNHEKWKAVIRLARISELMKVEFDTFWSCAQIKGTWRWENPRVVLPRLCDQIDSLNKAVKEEVEQKYPNEDDRVFYYKARKIALPIQMWPSDSEFAYDVWCDLKFLRTAFSYLDDQFVMGTRNERIPVHVESGILQTNNENYTLNWLWLEYNRADKKSDVCESHPRTCSRINFIDDNLPGNLIFNAWHIERKSKVVTEWFIKPNHGKATISSNNLVSLSCGSNISETKSIMRGEEGLLFTFRIRKQSRTERKEALEAK